MIQTLLEYYRIAEDVFGAMSPTTDSGSGPVGFFQFGAKNICYGRNRSGVAKDVAGSEGFDAWKDVRRDLCTFDLFSSIPTLDYSRTVTQETFAWNDTDRI